MDGRMDGRTDVQIDGRTDGGRLMALVSTYRNEIKQLGVKQRRHRFLSHAAWPRATYEWKIYSRGNGSVGARPIIRAFVRLSR